MGIGLGTINATSKNSIFRTTKNSILNRKFRPRTQVPNRKRNLNKSLLAHIKEKYDFVWNSATFRLDDDSDSVNFGDLVVSPPPSGKD